MASRRVIEAVLKFKDEFSKGMSGAMANLDKNSKKYWKMGQDVWKTGDKMERAGTALTKTVTAPIAGMAVAGVKNFGEVDKTMRLVEQTMGKTAWSAGDLEKAMKTAASNSVFSMNEAANASLNFARAGFDAKEASNMLSPAMNLAAGTSTELSTVTEGLGSALKMFGADSSEAAGYSNILAQAQSQANTTVSDLLDSISAGGNSFNTVGWNIKDLSVATGVLGDSMISGSEAGNAFKTGIARLASPAKDGAAWMDRLNIDIFNADGTMKSFTDTQRILHDSFQGLTDEQKEQAASAIFGKNQMDKWMALIKKSPSEISKMTGALNENENTAQNMSDALMNGLGGSIEKLKSTFDVFSYEVGKTLGPVLKPFVDKITELMAKFNGLDDKTKQTIVKFALMAAAIGPLLIGGGKLTKIFGNSIQHFVTFSQVLSNGGTAVSAFAQGFMGLSGTFTGFSSLLAGIATAVGPVLAVVAVIAVLVLAFKHLWETNEDFRRTMIGIWESIRAIVMRFVDSVKQRMPEIQEAFSNVVSVVKPLWEGFCQVLAPIFEGAFMQIRTIVITVTSILSGLIDVFTGLFTGNTSKVTQGLNTILSAILTHIVSTLQNLWTAINGALGVMFGGLTAKIAATFTGIGHTIQAKMTVAWNIVKTVCAKIKWTFTSAWSVIKSGVSAAFNSIKARVTSAMGAVASAIKSKLSAAKSTATGTLNSIRTAFTNVFNKVVSTVRTAINKIKGLFNFSWKLPDLKVPHVSVNGGSPPYGIGGKGSLPSFNVEWHRKAYDNAYLLKNPTIFGSSGGNLLGGGEGSGSEIIIGFDRLMRTVQEATLSAAKTTDGGKCTINIPKLADKIVVREDADIDRIAAAMAHRLEIAFADRGAFNG